MAGGEELAAVFGVSNLALEANLQGITEEESLKACPGGGNCVNWVVGHIVVSQGLILRQLGAKAVLGEEEAVLYGRGSPPVGAGGVCVSLERLKGAVTESHQLLQTQLRTLSDEALRRELPQEEFHVPVASHTLRTWLTLLLFHEAYHTGQLGILRRALGKEAVVT